MRLADRGGAGRSNSVRVGVVLGSTVAAAVVVGQRVEGDLLERVGFVEQIGWIVVVAVAGAGGHCFAVENHLFAFVVVRFVAGGRFAVAWFEPEAIFNNSIKNDNV